MTLSVVVVASGTAGDLVRTVDSIIRQRTAAELIVAAAETTRTEILHSLPARAGARLTIRPSVIEAVNEAIAETSAGAVMVVPAGVRLDAMCIEDSARSLDSGATAVTPFVRIESSDGVRTLSRPIPVDTVGLLADPASAPRTVALSVALWQALEGLRAKAGELAIYDLVLRASLHGALAQAGSVAVGCRNRSLVEWPPQGVGDEQYLELLRDVLSSHTTALNRFADDVLIAREIEFGRLRDRHRALVARRDRESAQLRDLREQAAHHHAWLEHHGEANVDWGDLRHVWPVSRDWGYDRGAPVDRHYIDAFVAAHSSDVHGAVLEVQENDLTQRFGGPRVERADVVDLNEENTAAALLADLRCAPHLPSDTYDCVVLTQTVHVIDDMSAVLGEVHRILKPGGVVLATMPAASRVCLEYGAVGDLWRVTPDGARTLFERTFDPAGVDVTVYGNVLTNVAFLHGLSRHELRAEEFAPVDPYFPAVAGVRARKSGGWRRRSGARGVVLLYHRIDDTADVHQLNVTRANFLSHLQWLRRHCSVMPLEQLLATAVTDLPEHPVAITFDDGYLDNLAHAAPALDSEGIPATFFLTTRHLDAPGEYWWDLLERAFSVTTSLPEVLALPLGSGAPHVATADRASARATLHEMLVRARLPEREAVVDILRRVVPSSSLDRRPLVADEVLVLSRFPGVSIGAHTVNHLSLPELTGEDEREIEESRIALERVLGQPVRDMAYPYGAVDERVAGTVRQTWRWACACGDGSVPDSFDAARVRRMEPGNITADQLARMVEGLFDATACR